MLVLFKNEVQKALDAYETTFEQDTEILLKDVEDCKLSNNERNSINLRKTEKDILNSWMNIIKTI